MIDLSFIGKDGLIIQYEDIISLIGFNVICYLKDNGIKNDKINRMSVNDILLSYINRQTEDISKWIKEEFDIDCDLSNEQYQNSIAMFRPNMLYAYKLFSYAYKNGIKQLYIHSNQYSKIIEQSLRTFDVPIEYIYGDIIPELNKRMNYTYITSSINNIKRCNEVVKPFSLVIVDDFMYVADLLIDKIPEQLISKNIFVQYTSILSAGIF